MFLGRTRKIIGSIISVRDISTSEDSFRVAVVYREIPRNNCKYQSRGAEISVAPTWYLTRMRKKACDLVAPLLICCLYKRTEYHFLMEFTF